MRFVDTEIPLNVASALSQDEDLNHDLHHGRDYGGVVAVNPFVDGRDREA